MHPRLSRPGRLLETMRAGPSALAGLFPPRPPPISFSRRGYDSRAPARGAKVRRLDFSPREVEEGTPIHCHGRRPRTMARAVPPSEQ